MREALVVKTNMRTIFVSLLIKAHFEDRGRYKGIILRWALVLICFEYQRSMELTHDCVQWRSFSIRFIEPLATTATVLFNWLLL
jgi:hypothetical protein